MAALLDWGYGSSQSPFVQRRTGFANGKATVLSGPTPVFPAPSFASALARPVLGTANNGATFTVLGYRNGFVQVKYQGQTGWVHVNAFIKTTFLPPPPSNGPPSEAPPGGTKG
jgi:hypothetical protein